MLAWQYTACAVCSGSRVRVPGGAPKKILCFFMCSLRTTLSANQATDSEFAALGEDAIDVTPPLFCLLDFSSIKRYSIVFAYSLAEVHRIGCIALILEKGP